MFKNNFRMAWRSIILHKVYSSLNIAGLAIGICACIVIYLITSYEFSFDRFHPDKERIYRIMGDLPENNGDKSHFARVPFPVQLIGRKELSGLDAIAGVSPYNAKISIPGGSKTSKHFDSRIEGTFFPCTVIAEPSWFSIFKYKWLAGNVAADPFTVVIAESKARTYFGEEPLDKIIGREIIYDDSLHVRVSGIVKDWNKNTDFPFTDFISFSTIQSTFLKNNFNQDSWAAADMPILTFAKLSKGVSPPRINSQMASMLQRHADASVKLTLWLEPLTAIHFNAAVIENAIRTAHLPTLYSLMGIALFILTLAVINFINLSTAQSIPRAKEVGVRKVLGGSRISLVMQFLTETLLLTSFAVLLAVLMVGSVLAALRSFMPTGVAFHFFNNSTITFLLLVTLVTSLLAGIYPAKVLSGYLPVLSLKGNGTQKGTEKWYLRKGLIVFQFTVSLIFIIGSIVINNQLSYTRSKDLGFTADAIIKVPTPGNDSLAKTRVVKERIKQLPGIKSVALEWASPGDAKGMSIKFKSIDEKETRVGQVDGDENLIPLYKIKLLAGRNLAHSDSVNEFIINESLAHQMGCKNPADAIGRTLYWFDKPCPVVGVVADFNSSSLHDPIVPLCIINRVERERTLAVKLATAGKESGALKATLTMIEKAWKTVYPDAVFEYQFYDELLAMKYEKDQHTATLINTSMLITIFISCMGLFGLAMFTAERRTKEIGIRKVLGASVANITAMLSKDFVVLVAISILIASPIAWYLMNQWLQDFVYRINISWWVFVLAGLSAILIAVITVSFQAIKAAVANPVKSLRTE